MPGGSPAASGPGADATGAAAPEVTVERLAAVPFTAEDLMRMIWGADDNGGLLLPDPDPTDVGHAVYAAPTAEDAWFSQRYWDDADSAELIALALVVETGRVYPSAEAAQEAVAQLRRMREDCAEYEHEYGELTGGLRYTRVGTVALSELAFPVDVPEPVEVFAFERRWSGEAAATQHYVMRLGSTVIGVDFRPWYPREADGVAPSEQTVRQREAMLPSLLQEQIDRMLWWAGYKIEAGAA